MDPPDWQARAIGMTERQIEARGIRDPRVLAVMRSLPRHRFVPEDQQDRAYDDCPLPIGLNQTISQPYIVAYMTELLDIGAAHRILEVGTGSGYQTAVLARIGAEVYTVDIHEDLMKKARATLWELDIRNVRFAVRDGHHGWPEFAPFDRIMVTAGAAAMPPALVEQLAVGGVMVIPTGAGEDQSLQRVMKANPDRVVIEDKAPVRFVPLIPVY